MKPIEKQADRLWADFVKNRDGCCIVGQAEDHVKCWGELHAHHLFSRRFRSTRWDPRNGATLCAYHHQEAHAHPLQHAVWRIDLRGEAVASELLRKAYGGPKPDVAAIVEQLKVGAEVPTEEVPR